MLAEYGDLVRYGVTVNVAIVQPFLEMAEQLARETCQREWDATGPQSKSFYNVRQGDIITLPDEYPTEVGVTVYETATDSGRLLQAFEYQVESGGRIRLPVYDFVSPTNPQLFNVRRDVSVTEALRSADRAAPVRYARVNVTFQASGVVPAPVREAVAMIAASSQLQAQRKASGLKSEAMGDYRYDRNGAELSVPEDAWEYLSRHTAAPLPGKRFAKRGQLIW